MLYMRLRRHQMWIRRLCAELGVRGRHTFVFLFRPLARAAATERHTYRVEVSSHPSRRKRCRPSMVGKRKSEQPDHCIAIILLSREQEAQDNLRAVRCPPLPDVPLAPLSKFKYSHRRQSWKIVIYCHPTSTRAGCKSPP